MEDSFCALQQLEIRGYSLDKSNYFIDIAIIIAKATIVIFTIIMTIFVIKH
jgi:hypothetical protein